MAIATSCSHTEMLQRYVDEFFEETGLERATAKEIAVWAIRTNRWEAPHDVLIRQCKEEFSKAMREEYVQGETGPVRVKHVARIKQGDKQSHLWADIRRAPREHMEKAFKQRREQIVSDCRQLNRDADYYNGLHPKSHPIQLLFDFTDDVVEGGFPKEYPPKKPR